MSNCCVPGCRLQQSTGCTKYATVAVLFLVNLLVSVDRWMIVGMLPQLQDTGFVVKLSDTNYWHLQLCFLVGYMFTGVWIGYFGDRYTRKYLMCAGVLTWSAFSLAGSFSVSLIMLLVTRCLMGVGQAAFSILAPTIVGDLFLVKSRLRVLALFLLATPLGRLVTLVSYGTSLCHLSPHYNSACDSDSLYNNWKLGLRIYPGLGCVAAIALALVVPDPPRGRMEDPDGIADLQGKLGVKAYLKDLWTLLCNKSLVFVSTGCGCIMFTVSVATDWGPLYMDAMHHAQAGSGEGDINLAMYLFALISIISGVFGILFGSECSKLLARWSVRHDTLTAWLGMLLTAPLLYFTLLVSTTNLLAAGVFLFLATVSLSVPWAPENNVTLYIVVPEHRSTAVAIKTLFTLLLGEAFSWPIITFLSGKIQGTSPDGSSGTAAMALSLHYSLYLLPFICIVGSMCFLCATVTVSRDRTAVVSYMRHGWHYVPARTKSKESLLQSRHLLYSNSAAS